jgi:hypothetical protein
MANNTIPDESLSENQRQFVREAQAQGIEVDYDYSGRGMFGKTCPAVRVDRITDLATKAEVCCDSMGMGYVIYARM